MTRRRIVYDAAIVALSLVTSVGVAWVLWLKEGKTHWGFARRGFDERWILPTGSRGRLGAPHGRR